MTELFTPAQLRGMGRCTECGWAPREQGHRPDCTEDEETDG